MPACAARHTPTLNALVGRSGRLSSHRRTRYDKTVLFMSCLLVCRCELGDCSECVQTSNFLSVTVLSCRECNSHSRSGRDTDKTVLSCLAWRCELALTLTRRQMSVMMIFGMGQMSGRELMPGHAHVRTPRTATVSHGRGGGSIDSGRRINTPSTSVIEWRRRIEKRR